MKNPNDQDATKLPLAKIADDWAKNFDYEKWRREDGKLLILDDYRMLLSDAPNKELIEIFEKSKKYANVWGWWKKNNGYKAR